MVENAIIGNEVKYSIAGIGLNLNQTEFVSDAPNPVSLKQITGKEYDIAQWMKDLLDAVHAVLNEPEEEIWADYKAHLYRREGWYPFEDKNGTFEARICDVLPTGEIILCDRQGNQRIYEFKQIRYVVRLFVNKYPEYRIINVDKLTYAGNLANLKDIEDKPNYRFVRADICDFDTIYALMQEEHVTGVIHLAAESHVDRSIKDPFTFARTNVMGTLSMLQAAKLYWESLPEKFEGKRFYHISTDEVYGALQLTHPEGIKPPFTTKASSGEHHLAYGEDFFYETTKYNPHSPYSASKASSDHFVRAFHDTYGMPTIVTNCSNNYGPYQFPEKLIPLFINNIRHRKPLPVYGKGENVRDWLYVVDHARAIDLIFHKGKIAETYNIGGFNEWKNIDIVKTIIATVDRLLGRPEGADLDLITYVTDRAGHDMRYAIDSTKLQRELD